MINKYSKVQDGERQLSPSFRVREFACHDGSDDIYIDKALVAYLQRIRNWAGAEVKITSGYRTASHNARIGGAASSRHIKGQAADIVVSGKSISDVARFAEAIGMRGIERNQDSNYVHVDTRPKKYFWFRKSGKDHTVITFGGSCTYKEPERTLRRGSSGDDVRWLQWWLKLWSCGVAVDGSFGAKTEAAVRAVQQRRGLEEDGIAGEKTRRALKGF